ncbi:MAG TPA: hypothetical protein PKC54_12630, partial [Ferruginibacter sp.]|nr:hypothetical protein [Ferruginibacter sp.]
RSEFGAVAGDKKRSSRTAPSSLIVFMTINFSKNTISAFPAYDQLHQRSRYLSYPWNPLSKIQIRANRFFAHFIIGCG